MKILSLARAICAPAVASIVWFAASSPALAEAPHLAVVRYDATGLDGDSRIVRSNAHCVDLIQSGDPAAAQQACDSALRVVQSERSASTGSVLANATTRDVALAHLNRAVLEYRRGALEAASVDIELAYKFIPTEPAVLTARDAILTAMKSR